MYCECAVGPVDQAGSFGGLNLLVQYRQLGTRLDSVTCGGRGYNINTHKKNPFRNSDRASDPKVRDNLHHPSKLDGLQLIVWSPGEDGAKRRELTNKIRSDFGYRTFGFVSRECVCICAPKPFRRSLLGHCSLYVQPNIHAKILIGRAPSDQKASKLCIIVH